MRNACVPTRRAGKGGALTKVALIGIVAGQALHGTQVGLECLMSLLLQSLLQSHQSFSRHYMLKVTPQLVLLACMTIRGMSEDFNCQTCCSHLSCSLEGSSNGANYWFIPLLRYVCVSTSMSVTVMVRTEGNSQCVGDMELPLYEATTQPQPTRHLTRPDPISMPITYRFDWQINRGRQGYQDPGLRLDQDPASADLSAQRTMHT